MDNTTEVVFDYGNPSGHAAELYTPVAIAEAIDGLESFDDSALERYRREGFVAVENAFTPEEVRAAIHGLDDLVMGKREGFKGVMFELAAKEILPTLPVEKRLDAVRKLWDFARFEPRLNAMVHHPKLTRVLEILLSGEPRMFQDMALIKPPRIGREKPWHQDHAYFDFPIGTRVVGVWIALDEATVENGCMRMLAGGHHDGPRLHFQRRDWQICDAEMNGVKPVAVPLRPGGLVLFDGLLPHGTPTNFSPTRRRAVQYHYVNESATKTSREERLAVFGSEGKDVTC